MKAFLRENQAFIALSKMPKKDVKNGITLFMVGSQASTDIIAKRMRYDIPEHLRGRIISVLVTE